MFTATSPWQSTPPKPASLVELAAKANATCQITHHLRFCPAIMRARQMVEDGFLGEVISFRGSYALSGYVDPNRPIVWRVRMEKAGGGTILDLGTHVLDTLRYLMGDFKSVHARLRTVIKERPASAGSKQMIPVDTDDQAIMLLELENGVLGSAETCRVVTGAQDGFTWEIHGTKGAMKFDLMDADWLYVYDDTKPHAALGGDRGWTAVETIQNYPPPASLPGGRSQPGWTRFHVASIHDFVSNVVEGRPGKPSFADGLAVLQVVDAAQRSNESGRWEAVSSG